MNKNNDVFSMLIGAAGKALAASGDDLGDLALGQLGVFSAESNLAVDAAEVGTDPENLRNFFLAVGVDTTGNGVLDNVKKSHTFQRNNVYAYTLRCYNPTREWIFDLVDFTAECDTDYSIRFMLDSGNVRQLSSNSIYKNYFVHTSCCEGCEECPSGDCNELAELLVDAVNNDSAALFSAVAIAPNTGTIEVTTFSSANQDVTFTLDGVDIVINMTGGSNLVVDAAEIAAAFDAVDGWSATTDGVDTVTYVKDTNGSADSVLTYVDTDTSNMLVTIVQATAVEVTDYATWIAANADACLGVRFTSATPSVHTFCGINPDYVKFREVHVEPTFGDSFACNGTWITTQVMSQEEGNGYDIAWEEYDSGGWEGNPGKYRQSGLHGLPLQIAYNVDQAAKYVVLTLSGNIVSTAGIHKQYPNPVTTRVAIPYGEDMTTNLVTLLDAVLAGAFGPLADDLIECPGDGTTVQFTEELTYDTDGIG